MIILSIDYSTVSTGYALSNSTGIITSGTIKPDKKLPIDQRTLVIADEMFSIIKAFRNEIELVLIEQAFVQANAKTGMALSHGQGMITYVAYKNGFDNELIERIMPNSWRKLLGYPGKLKRKELKEHAITKSKELGFWNEDKTEDQIEAELIGWAGQIKYGGGDL
jgi:Holliday junction resolvasome RuvABC endonuclease subunit